ncbi:hypothetical protein [Ruminococcus flavefaciens]|uniref:hypothetical protein n=1 Tax=Ruminococcus flavefaciens TaxID=1265 RepID=UPI0003084A9A|nr:hypothetical protein [Ruminococcus flavefaciens]
MSNKKTRRVQEIRPVPPVKKSKRISDKKSLAMRIFILALAGVMVLSVFGAIILQLL